MQEVYLTADKEPITKLELSEQADLCAKAQDDFNAFNTEKYDKWIQPEMTAILAYIQAISSGETVTEADFLTFPLTKPLHTIETDNPTAPVVPPTASMEQFAKFTSPLDEDVIRYYLLLSSLNTHISGNVTNIENVKLSMAALTEQIPVTYHLDSSRADNPKEDYKELAPSVSGQITRIIAAVAHFKQTSEKILKWYQLMVTERDNLMPRMNAAMNHRAPYNADLPWKFLEPVIVQFRQMGRKMSITASNMGKHHLGYYAHIKSVMNVYESYLDWIVRDRKLIFLLTDDLWSNKDAVWLSRLEYDSVFVKKGEWKRDSK